jgi:hypothetical protein
MMIIMNEIFAAWGKVVPPGGLFCDDVCTQICRFQVASL